MLTRSIRITLILLWLFCSVSQAGSLSHIQLIESETTTERTQQLLQSALVWGWVKYYHPAANAGKLDIDAELVRLLSQQWAADKQDMTTAITDWLTALPDWPDDAQPSADARQLYQAQSMQLLPLPLEWHNALAALANKPVKNSYYFDYTRWKGNYQQQNEAGYPDFSAEPQQVWLALFRYWNVIHYFFPYRDQMDVAWTRRFEELVPVFAQVKDEVSYRYALLRLAAVVQDGHAIIRHNNWMLIPGRVFLPVQFTILDGKVLVQNSYQIEGNPLQPGDEVLASQHQPTSVWLDSVLPIIPASGDPMHSSYLRAFLQRTNEAEVRMTIRRGETISDVTVPSFGYSQLTAKPLSRSIVLPKHQWLDGQVAYLKIYGMSRKEFSEAYALYQTADALVLDLRGYPNDSGTFTALMRHLVKGRSVALSFVRPSKGQPGSFHRFYDSKTGSWWPFGSAETRPIIALTSARSMSQSETNLMQLQQYPNSLLVGSNTAGANGDITFVTVPGDYQLYFSGLGVYYPDDTPMQRYGVLPDVLVQQTVADLLIGQDTQLNTALSILESGQSIQELRSSQAEKIQALPQKRP
jgi:hypothetical protein